MLTASAIAFYTDIRYRKIPNKLTFPLIVFALVYHGVNSGFQGLGDSLLGLTAGMFFLIIPVLAGGMGAGDLKFMMMTGALAGPYFVTQAFVITCIAGGFMAIAILIKQKSLWRTIRELALFAWWYLASAGKVRLGITPNQTKIPYAVCLFAGVVAAAYLNGWQI